MRPRTLVIAVSSTAAALSAAGWYGYRGYRWLRAVEQAANRKRYKVVADVFNERLVIDHCVITEPLTFHSGDGTMIMNNTLSVRPSAGAAISFRGLGDI